MNPPSTNNLTPYLLYQYDREGKLHMDLSQGLENTLQVKDCLTCVEINTHELKNLQETLLDYYATHKDFPIHSYQRAVIEANQRLKNVLESSKPVKKNEGTITLKKEDYDKMILGLESALNLSNTYATTSVGGKNVYDALSDYQQGSVDTWVHRINVGAGLVNIKSPSQYAKKQEINTDTQQTPTNTPLQQKKQTKLLMAEVLQEMVAALKNDSK